jgi:isoquinoline 1-oxidoreductase beta subunit
VAIGTDGQVTLVMPFVEMGQGTYTSMPMLIAEELEVDITKIKLEHAQPNNNIYAHPIFGVQLTGGSASTRAAWQPMRKAGAAARMMLVDAAAKEWKVDPATCHASKGDVIHASSGRKLSYGQLAGKAALLPVPKEITLKPASAFTLIGTSAKRLDTASKVNGSALFGIDTNLPGMKIAAVAACPVFGGKLVSIDESKARAVKGVRKIVKLDDAVAVIADHYGAARKALGLLSITWDNGPNANFSSAAWEKQLTDAAKQKGLVAVNEGSFYKLVDSGAKVTSAVYTAPALAHATMEPMNCTALVKKGTAELWLGTQAPVRVQNFVAKALGIDSSKVTVNNHLLGGGFGRRLEADYPVQAALIARQVNYPVKVIWSREEDMQHDVYRPFYRDEVAVAFDASDAPIGFSHRFVGSSLMARYEPAWLANGIDSDAVDVAESIYDFENKYVEYKPVESPVPTGFWRGVGPTHNTFVIESFIDELAHAAGKDPVAYRQAMLKKNPRALNVLTMVADKAGWGRKMESGSGMGVSVIAAWGSFAASVVECSVNKDGQIVLKRITSVVDCGQPINPDGVVAQMEGGQIFGLTAALYGKLTIENGRVVQSNFHDYPILRINEAPPISVHVVQSTESPGGMGEIGTAVIGPALANAVFAATGKRVRTLPFESEQLKTI